jgi:kynurenine/2-aminoadipate aminotransferase
MPNYEKFFSTAALARKPSPIRVLTAIQMASGPEMISLAGGMPNPTMFPIDGMTMGVSGKNLTLSQKSLAQDWLNIYEN